MKRLLYKPLKEGEPILFSREAYQHPTNGGRFRVYLDTEKYTYRIYDEVGKMDVRSGSIPPELTGATRYNRLLFLAKEDLMLLGIEGLSKESRASRTKKT